MFSISRDERQPRQGANVAQLVEHEPQPQPQPAAEGSRHTADASQQARRQRIYGHLLRNGMTQRRLSQEMAEFKRNPIEGCVVNFLNNDLFEWVASLQGPLGTPYEGGLFHMHITFPRDYPFSAPNLKFVTKIYHCNVHADHICVENWSPIMTLGKLLVSVLTLMVSPNLRDPMNPAIAKLYVNHRGEHDSIVRDWTKRFAMKLAESEE
ncbi:ubiquitin-conjugating enzyme E2 4-like [Drosophila hydei]|uniref:Ubiquitin-conjugating enzyme E2 4-like n=1 Tax=Drosophila hydei TaxID=7224 RepID=A0A6J1MAL5_DROHY|nr:ubiquitin-conjugating enzyme E2 4-like [Drosophila hydei]